MTIGLVLAYVSIEVKIQVTTFGPLFIPAADDTTSSQCVQIGLFLKEFFVENQQKHLATF